MKKLALSLAAFAFAAPSIAAAQDIAPPVKRKPAATSSASSASSAAPQPVAASTAPAAAPQPVATSTAPAAPQPAVRTGSEREAQAALAAVAAQGGSDAALDTSLIRVMSRLVAAGRCGEAATLATRDGRKELAARARQLCR